MTSTHKWVAGALALAIAILAGSWFALVAPKRSEAADLQAAADAQEQTNEGLETQLSVLKQQKKDLPQEQAKLAKLRMDIPQNPSIPTLIRLLDQAGAKSGVELAALSPQAAVPLGAATGGATADAAGEGVLAPGQLAAINAEIVVTGGYFEIVQFVNALENLDRYVLATDITISEEDAASETDSSGTSEGQLTASISSRVFLMPDADAVVATDTPAGTVEESTTVPTTESQ